MDWVPKISEGFDVLSIELNAEQGFILAFVDGHNSAAQIAELTGTPENELQQILQFLIHKGILETGPENLTQPVAAPPAAPASPIKEGLDALLGPVSPADPDLDAEAWEDQTDVDTNLSEKDPVSQTQDFADDDDDFLATEPPTQATDFLAPDVTSDDQRHDFAHDPSDPTAVEADGLADIELSDAADHDAAPDLPNALVPPDNLDLSSADFAQDQADFGDNFTLELEAAALAAKASIDLGFDKTSSAAQEAAAIVVDDEALKIPSAQDDSEILFAEDKTADAEEEVLFVSDAIGLVDPDDQEIVLFDSSVDDDELAADDQPLAALTAASLESAIDPAALAGAEALTGGEPNDVEDLPIEALQSAPDATESAHFMDIAQAAEILPVAALAVFGELAKRNVETRRQEAALGEGETLFAYALDPSPIVASTLLANPSCGQQHAIFFASYQTESEALHELSLHGRFIEDAQVRAALLKNPAIDDSSLAILLSGFSAADLATLAADPNASLGARQAAANAFAGEYDKLLPQDRATILLSREGIFLPLLADQEIDEDTIDLLCQERYDSADLLQAFFAYPGTPYRLLQVLYRQRSVMENDALKQALRAHPNWPQ